MRNYIGLNAADVAEPHDRWRAIWYNAYDWRDAALNVISAGIADTSAAAHAQQVFDTLAGTQLAFPISSPVVDTQADVFCLDVQLDLVLPPGMTVQAIADALEEAVPGCELWSVAKINIGEDSAAAATDRTQQLQGAAQQAAALTITQKATDIIGGIGTTVEHSFAWLAVAAVSALALYLVITKRRAA